MNKSFQVESFLSDWALNNKHYRNSFDKWTLVWEISKSVSPFLCYLCLSVSARRICGFFFHLFLLSFDILVLFLSVTNDNSLRLEFSIFIVARADWHRDRIDRTARYGIDEMEW